MRKYIICLLLFTVMTKGQAQLDFKSNKKFTKTDSLRGTLSAFRSCYDVLMYDLDIKVDIDNKYISGSNTIKFRATQSFRTLQVDLFANMNVEKVEYLGKELIFSQIGRAHV